MSAVIGIQSPVDSHTQAITDSDVFRQHLNNGYMETYVERFLSENDLFYFQIVFSQDRLVSIPLTPRLESYELAKKSLKVIKKIVPTATISMTRCEFSKSEADNPNRLEIISEILDCYSIEHNQIIEAVKYWSLQAEILGAKA